MFAMHACMCPVTMRACSYTGDMGPTQYRGRLVAVTKLMEACAHGGQIIMHLNTFQLLDKKVLPEDLVVLHMGKHVIKSSAARPSDMVPAPAKLPDGVSNRNSSSTAAWPFCVRFVAQQAQVCSAARSMARRPWVAWYALI